MRCSKCQEQLENIISDIRLTDWLKLMVYFEHELTEGEITEATYNCMTDCLTSLEPSKGRKE